MERGILVIGLKKKCWLLLRRAFSFTSEDALCDICGLVDPRFGKVQ